jgi:hypothetical protein
MRSVCVAGFSPRNSLFQRGLAHSGLDDRRSENAEPINVVGGLQIGTRDSRYRIFRLNTVGGFSYTLSIPSGYLSTGWTVTWARAIVFRLNRGGL